MSTTAKAATSSSTATGIPTKVENEVKTVAKKTVAAKTASPKKTVTKAAVSSSSRGRSSTRKSSTETQSSTRSRSKSAAKAGRVSDAQLARSTSAKTANTTPQRVSDSVKRSKSTSSVKQSTSSKTDATKKTETEEPVRRAKSFKRIRGLLRGKSKKSKSSSKNELTASKRAELAVGAGAGEDDGSTVYNVTLDDRSVAASTASEMPEIAERDEYLLRMVILLMDVKTRRFELLQLEFDSEKALVSDVLSQVPVSVTEESLRSQPYQGVVTSSGAEMKSDVKLSTFCQGSDVLVAVPKDLDPKEVARLSKPILSDPKVIGMLKSSGVNAKDWGKAKDVEPPTKVEKDGAWKSRQIPDYGKEEKRLGGTIVLAAVGFVVSAVIVNFLHVYVSTPIQPGHIVSPGIVLSKCGLLKGWPIVGPTCNRAYLEVSSGKVSYYEGKELAWVIHGSACDEGEVKAKTCTDGLEFREDGSLALGGEPVHWLERHTEGGQEDQLTPWPFVEKPKIKAWNIAASRLSTGAKEAVGKIKDGAADAAAKVKDGATKVKEGATDTALKLKHGAVDAAGKLKNTTVDTVDKIRTNTAETYTKLKDGAADKIKTATEKIKEAHLFTNTKA